MNRRSIFKLFGAGAAATVLPSVLASASPVANQYRAAPGTIFTADMLAKESCEIFKAHAAGLRIRPPVRYKVGTGHLNPTDAA